MEHRRRVYTLYRAPPPSPGVYFWPYIPFSRRWDTVRYSGIQLDTARYVRMQLQLDTVGYTGDTGNRDTVDLLQNG